MRKLRFSLTGEYARIPASENPFFHIFYAVHEAELTTHLGRVLKKFALVI